MRRVTALSLTPRQRKSIAAAIASGVPIKELVRSRRFPGITDETMAQIADEAGVTRIKRPRHGARRTV